MARLLLHAATARIDGRPRTALLRLLHIQRCRARRRLMRALVPLLIAISTLGPTPAAASQYASPYHELQAMDGQLATIGYRLATANAPLCERLDGATGLQLHDIAQYRDRDAITGVFAFESPVEVEAVVPGSPGDTAGILPDDALVALHHETQTQRIKAMTEGLTDDPYMRIQRIADAFAAATSAGHPVTLDLLRHGRPLSITLTPAPACATRFQLLIEKGYDAGNVDGIIGPETRGAIESFQQEKGITASGELNQETIDALGLDVDLKQAQEESGSQMFSE